jgi:adenosylmethionine-8-amino-7-oxononanoate aminotransferase
MSSVLYKDVNGEPIWAGRGAGVHLYDREGKAYLDTCGGVAVSSLGHCHPRIVAAVQREAANLAWAHAGSYTTDPAERLADMLVETSGGLSKAQFLSGGSEAMELALKIAYQYHCENGQPERTWLVARRQSYHGSTLATLAISGNRARRSVFEPLLPPAAFVSPCYAYRDRLAYESDEDYAGRLARELEDKFVELGTGNVCAFVLETVVGSTNGAAPAVPGYLRKVREVCDRHGVLLVLDEVMAGMGRTGYHYAYLEDGIVPDIVAVGKGLGAGYVPISAVVMADRIHAAMARGSGTLRNGQTNVNHPFACAVALEVQRTIMEEGLLEQVRARGRQLRALLAERLDGFACVGDIRGRGLLLGVELVADRASKAPCLGGNALVGALKREGFREGLLLYPGTGTVDGDVGNHVLFAPPFIASESEIADMVDRFATVLQRCVPI